MSGSRRPKAWLALVLGLGGNVAAAAAAAPPVLAAPQVFAPGVVSGPANDEAPTFSPDGNTLLFTRSGAGGGIILESHRVHGRWSTPVMASFSGTWPDLAPEFSPDGSYVVYVSIRRSDTRPARQQVGLWRVDRTGGGGWSRPERLPAAVNIGDGVWKASIARDGSIYFLSIDPGKGKRLYVSHYAHGAYQPAEPLPFPAQLSVTAPLFSTGDPAVGALFSGQSAALTRAVPAADLVRIVAEETGQRLKAFGG